MEFGLLGPLLVHDGEQPRAIGSAKQRVLLAALLLQAGQTVSTDSLTERLWNGRPPASADVVLRNHVLRLRRCIGAAGRRIITRNGGYLLDVAEEEFDLRRFDRLCVLAENAASAGATEEAAELLDDALTLWRGSALADIPSDGLHRDARPALEERRLDALELKLELQCALGRFRTAIPALFRLVEAHPLREGLWAHLMNALFRSGRQAEALDAYRRIERLLREELGIQPGPVLRALQRQILLGAATSSPDRGFILPDSQVDPSPHSSARRRESCPQGVRRLPPSYSRTWRRHFPPPPPSA